MRVEDDWGGYLALCWRLKKIGLMHLSDLSFARGLGDGVVDMMTGIVYHFAKAATYIGVY
jgi:hypothetical protein